MAIGGRWTRQHVRVSSMYPWFFEPGFGCLLLVLGFFGFHFFAACLVVVKVEAIVVAEAFEGITPSMESIQSSCDSWIAAKLHTP